jgi:hypothetical protein
LKREREGGGGEEERRRELKVKGGKRKRERKVERGKRKKRREGKKTKEGKENEGRERKEEWEVCTRWESGYFNKSKKEYKLQSQIMVSREHKRGMGVRARTKRKTDSGEKNDRKGACMCLVCAEQQGKKRGTKRAGRVQPRRG